MSSPRSKKSKERTNYSKESNLRSNGHNELTNSDFEYQPIEKQNLGTQKFGNEEYECKGVCYCESDRRGASLSQKGISYVLTAVSSVVALNFAKNYFEENCKKQMSDSCDTGSVISNVEDCSQITNSKKEKVPNEKRTYSCEGKCMASKNLKFDQSRNLAKKFGCEKLSTKGMVVVTPDKLMHGGVHISKRYHHAAVNIFLKDFMTGYCKEKSRTRYIYEYFTENNYGPFFHTKEVILCIGNHKNNKSVKCKISKKTVI